MECDSDDENRSEDQKLSDNLPEETLKLFLLIKEREMVAYKTGERIRVFDVMEKNLEPKIIHRVVVNSQNQALRHDEFDRTNRMKKPRHLSAYTSSSGKIRYYSDLSHWGEVVTERLIVAKELVISDDDYDKWARVRPQTHVPTVSETKSTSVKVECNNNNSDISCLTSQTETNFERQKIVTNERSPEITKLHPKLSLISSKLNSGTDAKWSNGQNSFSQDHKPAVIDDWCPYITDDKDKKEIHKGPYESFLTIKQFDKQLDDLPRASSTTHSNDPLTVTAAAAQQRNHSEHLRDAISFGMGGSTLSALKMKSKKMDLNPPVVQNNNCGSSQPRGQRRSSDIVKELVDLQQSYTDGYAHIQNSTKTKESKKASNGRSVEEIPQSLILLNSVYK